MSDWSGEKSVREEDMRREPFFGTRDAKALAEVIATRPGIPGYSRWQRLE